MKKTICLLLAALLLAALLCGCDLQNRKPSSEFVPENAPTDPTLTYETEVTEEATQAPTEVMQVTVREALMEEGSYTDRYGNSYTYKYHLPFIDGEARYAQGCNSEIQRLFGAEITAQRNAMANNSTLSILSVDYITRLRDDFLTIYITMKSTEGEETRAVYTLYRDTGDQVEGLHLLEWYGLDEETFLELAKDTVQDTFEEKYGEYLWTEMLRYNTARDRTMKEENFSVDMPMYFDEKDQLVILASIYDLAGEKHTEPLVIVYEPPEETEGS